MFVFLATLSNYTFHRIFPVYYHNYKTHPSPLFKWTIQHLNFLTVLFLSSLLLSVFFFLDVNFTVKIVLFALALLTMAYSLPLFKWKNKIIRLRDFSYLKIILIATTWAIVCGNLVLLNDETNYSVKQHLAVFIEKFLFLIAITIPFDIRDFEQDKIEAVKTIPNTLGIQQSISIAIFCLIGSLPMVLFSNANCYYKLAYFTSYLYTCILIITTTNKKSEMFYLFYLDAAFILLGVLIFIVYLVLS